MHFIDTSDIYVFAHCIPAPPLAEAQRYSASKLHGDMLKICNGIIFDFYPRLPQYLVCRSKVTFKGSSWAISFESATDSLTAEE